MRMPDDTFDLLKTFANRNPLPQGVAGAAHEENCRAWTRKLAEQCAFTFPDQGYGCKRAGPGRPLSKDCLAQRAGGQLIGYDTMIAAGSGRPTVPPAPPEAMDLGQQVFEPVLPRDHLNLGQPAQTGPAQPGPAPVAPPAGQQPPAPPSSAPMDLAPVLTQLARLQQEVAALRADVSGLRTAIEGVQPADGPSADSVLRSLLEQAGWPVEIQAGVLGTLSGWVGRKP